MKNNAAEPKVKMLINNSVISNNPFVDSFIAGVIYGLVTTLDGADSCRGVQVTINEEVVSVAFDASSVEINDFVRDMIKGTLTGMAGVLGVAEPVKHLSIRLNCR